MAFGIFLSSIVILICVLLHKITQRFGIPLLLAFILLGLLFGSDGLLKIPFENYGFAEQICSIALIFIMFYGGFGTSWKEAKPVAITSVLLSTLGVVLTAAFTALFCYGILHLAIYESLLIGAVISSTDAASVFSILRSKKLGLKYHSDSLLELESGSNDPMSYMLSILVLTAMGGELHAIDTILMFIAQFAFGIIVGALVAFAAVYSFRHIQLQANGFDMACMIGIALLSYALATLIGGNGYLSVYLCGIILGNQKLPNQKELVHFFDGITSLMQMLIFFLLGLLATPSRIPQIFLPALGIMIFLTLIARPLSVFMIMTPFRCTIKQQLLVSFAGLRGAASIVFAIMATVSPSQFSYDLYHIIFCIVILSITLQGTLLPQCAKWLKMTDQSINVFKTFSDYSEESRLQLIKVKLQEQHSWIGKQLCEIVMPPDMLVAMVLRSEERIIPNGKTRFEQQDIAILCAHKYLNDTMLKLQEYAIAPDSEWINQTIHSFSPSDKELVIMMIRKDQTIIPKGNTLIAEDDVLVLLTNEYSITTNHTN